MRFFDRLMRARMETQQAARIFSTLKTSLRKEETKRILLDGQQAGTFWDLGEGPPDNIQVNLMMPFRDFYLEFDSPVAIYHGDYEWSNRVPRYVRALLVRTMPPSEELAKRFSFPISVVMFTTFRGTEDIEMLSFVLDLNWGHCWASIDALYTHAEMAEMPEDIDPKGIIPLHEDTIGEHRTFRAWAMIRCGTMLSWCMAYMMAKSVLIEKERLPRQQRRRMERKGIPNPWHVVTLDPKVMPERPEQGSDERDKGSSHGYCYDVIGHIRMGKYRLKDGSYTTKTVWVKPHKRGVRNERYIPSVKRMKGGRTVDADLMENWWGTTPDDIAPQAEAA